MQTLRGDMMAEHGIPLALYREGADKLWSRDEPRCISLRFAYLLLISGIHPEKLLSVRGT